MMSPWSCLLAMCLRYIGSVLQLPGANRSWHLLSKSASSCARQIPCLVSPSQPFQAHHTANELCNLCCRTSRRRFGYLSSCWPTQKQACPSQWCGCMAWCVRNCMWLCVFRCRVTCKCACWQAAAQAKADEREAAHEDAVSTLRKELAAEAEQLQDMAGKAADDTTAHAAATAKLDSELCDAKNMASGAAQELQALRTKACL